MWSLSVWCALLLPSEAFLTPGRGVMRASPHAFARHALSVMVADYYEVLGVQPTATPAQVKQAYRRLALRRPACDTGAVWTHIRPWPRQAATRALTECRPGNHPDVNKAANAQEIFSGIAEAYSVLADPQQRSEYDRKRRTGRAAGAGAGVPRGTQSRGQSAAAAERARRWKEQNPTPDELGDSFGALLGDLVSAVGKAVAGGNWLELLGDLQADGPELEALLRTRDPTLLREELEEARWVEEQLRARMARLRDEAAQATREAETYRARGRPAASSVARSVERELERDADRWRAQAVDAERLLLKVQQRQRPIEARIMELRSGSDGASASSGSGRRSTSRRVLPSVEEELERMKRDLGR